MKLKSVVRLCAALSAFAASPSIAAQSVTIHPGETVTLSVQNGSVTVLNRTGAKEMGDFESDLLRKSQMVDVPPDVKTMPAMGLYRGEVPVDPPKIAAGVVSITFRHVPGIVRGSSENSFLTILNGYPAGLRYRAVMHRNGQAAATDVCGVLSQRTGTEHWPYAIDSLDLSDFRLEPFADANVPCG